MTVTPAFTRCSSKHPRKTHWEKARRSLLCRRLQTSTFSFAPTEPSTVSVVRRVHVPASPAARCGCGLKFWPGKGKQTSAWEFWEIFPRGRMGALLPVPRTVLTWIKDVMAGAAATIFSRQEEAATRGSDGGKRGRVLRSRSHHADRDRLRWTSHDTD